jgi:hypothetical protein
MWVRIKHFVRVAAFAVAAAGLGGAPLWAQASDCGETAVGGQSGHPYKLKSQSLMTETRTYQVSTGGPCAVGGSATVQYQEQYNVGFYENQVTGDVLKVDCRTGRVIK